MKINTEKWTDRNLFFLPGQKRLQSNAFQIDSFPNYNITQWIQNWTDDQWSGSIAIVKNEETNHLKHAQWAPAHSIAFWQQNDQTRAVSSQHAEVIGVSRICFDAFVIIHRVKWIGKWHRNTIPRKYCSQRSFSPKYFNDCSIYFELNMSRVREVVSWELPLSLTHSPNNKNHLPNLCLARKTIARYRARQSNYNIELSVNWSVY